MSGISDYEAMGVEEHIVLEKFEGDPEPENLVERVTLNNGEIVQHEFIENGEVVRTIDFDEGGDADAAS